MISWFIDWMMDAGAILCLALKAVILYCLILYYLEHTISSLEDCRFLESFFF